MSRTRPGDFCGLGLVTVRYILQHRSLELFAVLNISVRRAVAFIVLGFCQQAHEVGPWLLDSLNLPVRHKLTYRTGNVDKRMMPGIKYHILIHLPSADISGKRVVKGEGIINLVPALLAERREFLCPRGLK